MSTQATNTVISKDGTPITFDRMGTGPALILVGGAFQYRAFDPRTVELAELLSNAFTVYHYDRRGRGDSGDTQPYAVDREIEDLEALIADAGGWAYLFGHSSGGVLALDAAARGLPVPKLALYEAPVVVDDRRPPVPENYEQHLNELIADGARDEAVEYFLTTGVGLPALLVAQMRRAPMWAGIVAVAPTLAYDAALAAPLMTGGPLPADRWTGVAVPVLVANGGNGEPSMHTGADALAAQLPGSVRRTLPNEDHGVEPAVLAPLLIEFFTA